MIEKLEDLKKEFETEFVNTNIEKDLIELKGKYLGKKGLVSDILKSLKDATPEQRKEIGPKANQVKQFIQLQIDEKIKLIEIETINKKLSDDKLDISFRDYFKAKGIRSGGVHPINKIQREIEDIFLSLFII